jgi:8-hydroxy-5-deazaflavin:NADPH oxidoreductase
MKIGILGSGMVGQTLAAKLAERGQDVMVGARSAEKVAAWAAGAGVKVGSLSETAAHGEIVINATKGEASVDALRAAGEANLANKILMDIANPLDFSRGMPPTLWVSNTDSLGEQIQRAFPQVRVVKTLNTLNAGLMVNPGALDGGDHTIFVSGNDAAAKAEVSRLLAEWFGWRDIIDLGDITTARGTESLLPVWIRLMMAFGHANFQFKIVR